MEHQYQITGMTCNGCQTHVQKTLSEVHGVSRVEVNLQEKTATIEMQEHIPLETFKAALEKEGGQYDIGMLNEKMEKVASKSSILKSNNAGKYYCPMHCEGDKMYDQQGNCPVCGMDLVQQAGAVESAKYTCPMHPEIIEDKPGNCPICGMTLDPVIASASPSPEPADFTRRRWISTAATVSLVILTRGALVGLPVRDWVGQELAG